MLRPTTPTARPGVLQLVVRVNAEPCLGWAYPHASNSQDVIPGRNLRYHPRHSSYPDCRSILTLIDATKRNKCGVAVRYYLRLPGGICTHWKASPYHGALLDSDIRPGRKLQALWSQSFRLTPPFIPNSLINDHHLLISASCGARRASGLRWSSGNDLLPEMTSRDRAAVSAQSIYNGSIEFVDDVFRRALRGQQTKPKLSRKALVVPTRRPWGFRVQLPGAAHSSPHNL
jgi:hypothetical protein